MNCNGYIIIGNTRADTTVGPYDMVDKYYQEPRKRMRLEGYDYSLDGFYVVTICTQGRIHYFEQQATSDMVRKVWHLMQERNHGLNLDEFVVMPNHIHGIIQIVGADHRVGPLEKPYLSRVLQWFKTITTNDYLIGVKERGWQPLMGKLWQRGFYDRIIRSEEELNVLRKYVRDNPDNWDKDEENNLNTGPTRRSAPTIG